MLTIQIVEYIAKLARLGLNKKEKEKFGEQLSKILDFVEQLQKVEVKNIEPIAQITGLENRERIDEVEQFAGEKKLLDLAPDTDNGYFKIKTVF
ncbi:MAG: aspartyl-tRNA(Asn)/glutamyl-tRNA (Gln) amidotransferase subunit C [Parcubacteria group bacterium Athens1014_10]|nr:MAG: aspartyl-tRNA(Asn)/glutamyl-tRNA (Gln) amidotransferase subunit C [Parcubacteria group bacterium Athens1014_10]TSD05240.1 MAG: aspartyl-tRNA(Asn)/glutamyl-tRNA (Gln) amidotransferase subunit C [Parcubacteria group bacterium Athens0714_12]